MKVPSLVLRRIAIPSLLIPIQLALTCFCGCDATNPPPTASPGLTKPSSPVERPSDKPADPPPSDSDVIVVGAGISGLSATLELARGGATVTLIDMSSVFGGHAVMSQGSLSIAGSPVQE